MIEGQSDSLEQALARTEADADVAIKAATGVLGALRRFRGAARQGKIRELETAIEAARTIEIDEELAELELSTDHFTVAGGAGQGHAESESRDRFSQPAHEPPPPDPFAAPRRRTPCRCRQPARR